MTVRWRTVLVAAGAALIVFQLFVPPVLGVADNHDFEKLRIWACIGPESPTAYPYFDYFEPSYVIRPEYCGVGAATSAIVPLTLSVWIARMFLPAGHFDLRFLAAVYALLYLGAFWFLCREISLAAGMAVLIIFFSAVYIPLFNSFYMDAATLVCVAWAVALSIHILHASTIRWYRYVVLAGVLVLLAASKAQYVLAPVCFLPVFWLRFAGRLPLRFCLSAAVVLFAGVSMAWVSPFYRAVSLFDGLFFKFLPACENPKAEVRRLGLPPKFESYVGMHAYYPATHMQEREQALAFGRVVGLGSMLRFLLTHPRADLKALEHDLDEASLERVRMKIGQREYRLGNYRIGAGHPPEAQSSFLTVWSACKQAFLARRPAVYFGYILGLLAALSLVAMRLPAVERQEAITGIAILTALVPATFLPAYLDAVDTGRHLILFNGVLDMCICALAGIALRKRGGKKTSKSLPSD